MVVALESATHKTTAGFIYRSFSGSPLLDADVKGSDLSDFPKPVMSLHITLHQQDGKTEKMQGSALSQCPCWYAQNQQDPASISDKMCSLTCCHINAVNKKMVCATCFGLELDFEATG